MTCTRIWRVALSAISSALLVVVVSLVVWPDGQDETRAEQGESMGGMATPSGAPSTVPPVDGFYAGRPIQFIHTETSHEEIAQLLTGMMGSPVLLVPQLADVPASALGNVFVFTNGVIPQGTMGGPLGFQPDVFDSAPGDVTYSPLRAINLVTWQDETAACVLMSAEEIGMAEQAGEVTIQQPGIVVNMPFLTWPGGHR